MDYKRVLKLSYEKGFSCRGIANSRAISYVYAIKVFVENVRSFGKWDLKRKPEWQFEKDTTYIYNGIVLEQDEPGSIMFGYVGSALFDVFTLKVGAGLYQQYEGNSKEEWINWNYFGDEPKDTRVIEYGYWFNRTQRSPFFIQLCRRLLYFYLL